MLPAQPIERGPCSRRSMTTIVKDPFAERGNAADWDALTDADPAALRCGRLERAAPRPVWGQGVPASGGDQPERTRCGPHRRRVPPGRAATPRTSYGSRSPLAVTLRTCYGSRCPWAVRLR